MTDESNVNPPEDGNKKPPDLTCSHCGRDMNRRPWETCSNGGSCESITERNERLAASPIVQPAGEKATLPELDVMRACQYCGGEPDHKHGGGFACGDCCGMHGELSDDEHLYQWIKDCAKSRIATLSALTAARAQVEAAENEVVRLTQCLNKSNEGFEEYERKFYLEQYRVEEPGGTDGISEAK